jgi:acetate kinase
MNILVINSGSSSIKFQLIGMPEEALLCEGLVERIGMEEAVFQYRAANKEFSVIQPISSHKEGLQLMSSTLFHSQYGLIRDKGEIGAVGHRVVHGGDTFSTTTRLTEEVKREIQAFTPLAPLHNPHNLEGIQIAEELFPDAAQIAVFDTAFHRTMPLKARKYAIPNTFYEKQRIQAYGFHGTSHKYVAERAIAHLGRQNTRIITIHLGNGCSMTAVRGGKSIDHSLGFAPSNGLIMGSRSGDIDHSLIFYLADTLGYSLGEIQQLLTKQSGMLGLTGYTDLRDIQAGAESGDANCLLALEMSAYRIKKYIGAYTAAMNGLDALVFTAGIGENSALMRKMACEQMEYLGILLDETKNAAPSRETRELQAEGSGVKILVVPTNEELEIARQAYRLILT